MKKLCFATTFFAVLALLFLFSSCRRNHEGSSVVIDNKKSFFQDFEVVEESVVFRCHYVINNQTDKELSIQLLGDFEKEYGLGCIKEKKLFAQTSAVDTNSVFVIKPGKNTLEICFVGTFNGTKKKANRLLPPTTVIQLDGSPIDD